MAARRKKVKLVTLPPEPQAETRYAWGPDGSNGDKLIGKLPPIHAHKVPKGQTMNLWFVAAIAVVSAVIGALFGGLAIHP